MTTEPPDLLTEHGGESHERVATRRATATCRRYASGDPCAYRTPATVVVADPTRIIVGTATFFDAFDAFSIASVLPAIRPLWHFGRPEIGLLISAGFFGQLLGALVGGWLAERLGRLAGDRRRGAVVRPVQHRLRLRVGL